MRRHVLCWLLAAAAWAAAAEVIEAPQDVPAYSQSTPHEQRGLFPAGARLEVLGDAGSGMVRVRFVSSSGRVVEGLCRRADLQPPPAKAPAAAPPPAPAVVQPMGLEYRDRSWLEDAAGHKRALEFQGKYGVPILIFFYADWNDDCAFLWKELLDNGDFKDAAKGIIKLRINPEHGKAEGQLANKYRLNRYPTTLVVGHRAEPRRVDLVYRSFGKLRVPKPEYAILEINGAVDGSRPWESEKAAEEQAPDGSGP